MTALLRHLLATLWLAIAAFFTWAAIGQVQLMLAPEGSEPWRHSEWALPAAVLCIALAVPYLVSGLGLMAKWRWQRLWVYGPLLLVVPLGAWIAASV